MTKKFWNDWQKRVYETWRIVLRESVKVNDRFYNKWNLVSHTYADDEIIDAKFDGDTVDLTIKKFSWVFGKNGDHLHSENFYVTLDRENIKTVEFNRKY
jgi:hypothetical protein